MPNYMYCQNADAAPHHQNSQTSPNPQYQQPSLRIYILMWIQWWFNISWHHSRWNLGGWWCFLGISEDKRSMLLDELLKLPIRYYSSLIRCWFENGSIYSKHLFTLYCVCHRPRESKYLTPNHVKNIFPEYLPIGTCDLFPKPQKQLEISGEQRAL